MIRITRLLGNVVAWLLVWAHPYEDDPPWYSLPVWLLMVPVMEVWLWLHARYFMAAERDRTHQESLQVAREP